MGRQFHSQSSINDPSILAGLDGCILLFVMGGRRIWWRVSTVTIPLRNGCPPINAYIFFEGDNNSFPAFLLAMGRKGDQILAYIAH